MLSACLAMQHSSCADSVHAMIPGPKGWLLQLPYDIWITRQCHLFVPSRLHGGDVLLEIE
jgi:hypothetical protein